MTLAYSKIQKETFNEGCKNLETAHKSYKSKDASWM